MTQILGAFSSPSWHWPQGGLAGPSLASDLLKQTGALDLGCHPGACPATEHQLKCQNPVWIWQHLPVFPVLLDMGSLLLDTCWVYPCVQPQRVQCFGHVTHLSFTVLAKPPGTIPQTWFPCPLLLSPSRKVYFLKPTA